MGRGAVRVAIYARVSTADQNPELQVLAWCMDRAVVLRCRVT